MKLTKDNLYEYMKSAEPGSRIYMIRNRDIYTYCFACPFERNKGLYAYDDYDHTKAILISIYSVKYTGYFTDYEEAKEVLWKSVLKDLKDIDEVYFRGIMNSKEILKIADYENI